jgi:thymidine kinase
MRGTLKVYTGPMYAGKTTKVLQDVLWLNHQKKKVLIVKPAIDNRYGDASIVTHNQLSYPCVTVSSLAQIWNMSNVSYKEYHTICIDEAQFIDDTDAITFVEHVLSEGINVIASGLDQDSRGVPFDTTAKLMALADDLEKIKGICGVCGKEATKTYRINATGDRIQVGSEGMYDSRCLEHWEPR